MKGFITISGSRDINQKTAYRYLDKYLLDYLGQQREWIIGGAKGLDRWATEWLLDRNEKCWIVVPFRTADQPQCTQSLFDKVAKITELKLPKANSSYHRRNRYMVNHSDIVFAFWADKSKGTLSTINYAISASKEVHVFPVSKGEEV